MALAKRSYGWPEEAKFLVPDEVYRHFREGVCARAPRGAGGMGKRGSVRMRRGFPSWADHLSRMQRRDLPDGWDSDLPQFPASNASVSGRDASGKVLNAIAPRVPWLMGGAADLAPSTKTRLTFGGAGDFGANAPHRAQPALRRARARDERGAERLVALEAAPVRIRVPDLQRLRAPGHSAERADGDPCRVPLYA